MVVETTRRNQQKLVLFVRKDDSESCTALSLLQDLKPYVIERKGMDDETILPWLNTPTSNYYGLESIKGYVDYEEKSKKEGLE